MAKDTEKLIRQLSLISFLMAQGRPVSALEIKREVEGYSDMNDDAFARRFYADRAELESLGIELGVEKPGEGFFEAELYSLPPENFYLPAIEFSDDELAALRTALSLLTEGGFAYAEPLRLALQQVAWGHPNPLSEAERAPVEMAMTASAGGRDLSQRLSKIETAISRRKTIEFTYYTMERDDTAARKVDPFHLVFRGGQFYLIGFAHERDAVRVFRLSRIQGKVGYASKAEHDFTPPEDFDRRDYAQRADWQLGELEGTAKIWVRDRIAWLIERDFGEYGSLRPAAKADKAPGKGRIFETSYANERELIAWVLRWRQNAKVLDPPTLRDEAETRLVLLRDRHANGFKPAKTVDRPLRSGGPRRSRSNGRGEAAIRPERFARLVTLAGQLIESAKRGERLRVAEVTKRLKLSEEELAEDIEVLNVVNFGGGTYVLYAEIQGEEIEVDSEPYGDNFARPARLLPLEAKALIAAIDLFGDHLPQTGLQSARGKIVAALGPRSLRGGPGDRPRGRQRQRGGPDRQRGDRRAQRPRPALLQGERGSVHEALGRALPPGERQGGLVRRVLRPGARGDPPLQARPGQGGQGLRRVLRAPPRGRGDGRGRGLDDRRRGPDRERRAGLGLPRAGAVAARGADRGRGAGRRRGRRRAALRRHLLAGQGDPARRRRPGGARAQRRARGDRRGADRLSEATDVAPSHPEVERIVAPNPGPMTLEGTNTYLYGSDPCLVIDPGPDDASHLDAVRAAAERRGGHRSRPPHPLPRRTTPPVPLASAPR